MADEPDNFWKQIVVSVGKFLVALVVVPIVIFIAIYESMGSLIFLVIFIFFFAIILVMAKSLGG